MAASDYRQNPIFTLASFGVSTDGKWLSVVRVGKFPPLDARRLQMTDRQNVGRPRHKGVLTATEWRVAEGVRHGLTNRQIAIRRSTSVDAVKFHVSNILGKLGFSSRKELRLWNGIEEESSMFAQSESDDPIDGAIEQIARTVSDLEASVVWFRDFLGLEHQFSAGGMAFLKCQGVRLMLTEGEAAEESLIYFRCNNIQSQHKRLLSSGVKIISAPHRIYTHEDGKEEWMFFSRTLIIGHWR